MRTQVTAAMTSSTSRVAALQSRVILYCSMMIGARLRSYIWLLRHSHYAPTFCWYSPTPDWSRLTDRKLLRESSFNCRITPTNLRIPLEGRDDIDATLDIFCVRH